MVIRRNRNPSLALRQEFFHPFETQFNKLVDDFFKNSRLDSVKYTGGYPKMDVGLESYEGKMGASVVKRFFITMAVPGCTLEDIQVIASQDEGQETITIMGEMAKEYQAPTSGPSHCQFFVKELKRSKFERTVYLPEYVEGDPEASLKDGVLKLAWKTKGEKDKKPKRNIDIKST
jgi:HSP20 family molecular chaperone IbpA